METEYVENMDAPCDEKDLVGIFRQAAEDEGYGTVAVEVAPLCALKVKWMRSPDFIALQVADSLIGARRGAVEGCARELLARIAGRSSDSFATEALRRELATPEFARRWQGVLAERAGLTAADVEVPEWAPEETAVYYGHAGCSVLTRAVLIPPGLSEDDEREAVADGCRDLADRLAAMWEGD